MSRKRVKFTQYSLDRFLNIAEYNDSLFDSEIKNLEVRKRKTPSSHLSFITQMKIKGETKPTSFKLGSYPEHDINEIRFRYNEYRKLCLDGINPRDIFERQKQEEQRVKSLIKQRNMTLQAVFDDYLDKGIHLQSKTIKDMKNSLNYNCKDLLKKPISNISATEIERRIEGIFKDGKKHSAFNVFSYLSILFKHAIGITVDEKKNISLIDLNPIDKLLNLRKKIKKSLPQRKVIDVSPIIIQKLFDEANKMEHPQYEGVFKNREYMFNLIHLILFTGLRLNEACRIKWQHVNLEDKRDEFKYPHMIVYGLKGDQDQTKGYCTIVPLTKYLMTILNNQKKISGNLSQWVFPSNNGRDATKGDDSKPMNSPAKNIKKIAQFIGHPFSLHDLRHLFATIALNLGYPEDMIRKLLNHGIASITQRYLHQIISESYEVYNTIHQKMLSIWDMEFLNE